MGRLLKGLFYFFVTLVVLYVATWFGGVYYAKKALPDFFKKQGGEITYTTFDIRGFPFDFLITLDDVRYTLPHNQAVVTGAVQKIGVVYRLFSPFTASFDVEGTNIIVNPKAHPIAPQLTIAKQTGVAHFSPLGLTALQLKVADVHFQEKELPFIKVEDIDFTLNLAHGGQQQSFDWTIKNIVLEGLTQVNNPLFPVHTFMGHATLRLANDALQSVAGQMEVVTGVTQIKAQPHFTFAAGSPSGDMKLSIKDPRAVFRSLMDNNIFGLPFANTIYQLLPRKYRKQDFIDVSLHVQNGEVDMAKFANQFLS